MNILLQESPEIYSQLRLKKELEHTGIRNVIDSLDFEISLYEEVPHLISRNYETIEHFLAYITEVKNYKRKLDEARNATTDI